MGKHFWLICLRVLICFFLDGLKFDIDNLNQPVEDEVLVEIKLQIQVFVLLNLMYVFNGTFQFGQVFVQTPLCVFDGLLDDLFLSPESYDTPVELLNKSLRLMSARFIVKVHMLS